MGSMQLYTKAPRISMNSVRDILPGEEIRSDFGPFIYPYP